MNPARFEEQNYSFLNICPKVNSSSNLSTSIVIIGVDNSHNRISNQPVERSALMKSVGLCVGLFSSKLNPISCDQSAEPRRTTVSRISRSSGALLLGPRPDGLCYAPASRFAVFTRTNGSGSSSSGRETAEEIERRGAIWRGA